ncbi:MAG: hypothetical protein QHH07_00665 [Sedimentisphaerales bacterium]|nr:hypothetical protein [Sedimentisphaerales bacterium]
MWWILAGFTQPLQIGLSAWALLWMLPLTGSIAIVYKATKVGDIRPRPFFKEVVLLFASIVVFMAVAGLVLCCISWVVDNKIGGLMAY